MHENTCKIYIEPELFSSSPLKQWIVLENLVEDGRFTVFSLHQLTTQNFWWIISHSMMKLIWICKRLSSLPLLRNTVFEWHFTEQQNGAAAFKTHKQNTICDSLFMFSQMVGGIVVVSCVVSGIKSTAIYSDKLNESIIDVRNLHIISFF